MSTLYVNADGNYNTKAFDPAVGTVFRKSFININGGYLSATKFLSVIDSDNYLWGLVTFGGGVLLAIFREHHTWRERVIPRAALSSPLWLASLGMPVRISLMPPGKDLSHDYSPASL